MANSSNAQRGPTKAEEIREPNLLRVLLVEDDEDDYIMVRDLLSEVQENRFRLDWVSSYEEGEKSILKSEHDVYLVDYRLSQRTGLELLRSVLQKGCRAPVIMLTGLGDHDVDAKVLQTGAADYLVKGQINSSLLSRSIRYSLERAKTLETLRESEERFKRLADATLEGIAFLKDGLIYDLNQAAATMFGYHPEELMGKNPTELIIPEDRKIVTEYIQSHYSSPYEVTALRKDSTTFPIEVFGRSFSFQGFEGRVTAIRDLTERKKAEEALRRSEEKYRTIFEQSHDTIFITKRDGRHLDVNQSALDLLGYSRKEMMSINTVELYANPEERLNFQKEIEIKGSVKDYDVQFKRKDGRLVDCLITASLRRDSKGEVIGYQGIIRDVTERKRMEENMLHSQKLKSLGVLAGGIAHDFNNLLMVIMGKAGIARKQLPTDSPAIGSLNHISTASQRAAELCKQMLAYAGKGRFEMQILNLNKIIEETLQLLQISIAKGVSLKYEPEKELAPICGDATQIRQVVMNLVVNASEAMGTTGGTTTVKTGTMKADKMYLSETYLSQELPEGDYVFMEVADTGAGMTPETQARIFDPFFTTKFAGRGLGLAAVLGITRGHKGALKIKSKLGVGTTFRFLLPKANGKPINETVPEMDEDWQGSGTALVVDDEENVRNMAAQMLDMLGYKVISANDGIQGMEIFKSRHQEIDLILLDLTMPRMNGYELFREIRKIKPDAATILMSGYNEESAAEDLQGKARSGFLHKPFDFTDLRNKLRATIDK
jgi:two-component system cell cycle sensor histidine kinase/response regulator CckA